MTAPRGLTLRGRGLDLAADRWDAVTGDDRGSEEQPKGTVVLLHGGGQTRHSWRRTAERLAPAGWTAIAVDTRGHGESEWSPGGSYGMEDMVGDVVEVARALDQRPVLVGASMGGLSALVAAGEHPDLVRALVLVDIVPQVEGEGAAEIATFMRSGADGFASLDEAAAAVAAYTPHRRREPNLEGLRKNLRPRNGRWFWHWDPALMRTSGVPGSAPPGAPSTYPRMVAAAARVTIPTMVVHGRHSRVVSAEGIREVERLIPQCEVADVADAAHMIAGDDNDVFAARLLDFLERLDGR